jgi:hypothetical protein
MKLNTFAAFLVSALLTSMPFLTYAQEGNTTIRGFSTIGLVNSGSGDNLRFRRNLARTDEDPNEWSFASDSILGLQIDSQLNDQWSLSAQGVYKNRITQSFNNSVEWAYIGYQVDPSSTINYKIGRLGVNVFMLSEYRNVGYAYLWARPPIEFYSPIAFDSIDGADITYSTLLNDAFVQARLTAGNTQSDVISDEITLKASPAIAASLLWEKNHWKLRLGYAYIKLNESVSLYDPLIAALNESAPLWPDAPTIADDLDFNNKTFNYYSLGLTYDNNDWVIQTELNQVRTRDNVFSSFQSGYLSIGRRIDAFTIYGIGSLTENIEPINQVAALPDLAPPQLELFRSAIQEQYNSISVDQKTFGLGVRWDFKHNAALKLQVDRTWIKPHGAGLWGKETSNTDNETVDTLSINLNFLF